jgi:hypothetical protein
MYKKQKKYKAHEHERRNDRAPIFPLRNKSNANERRKREKKKEKRNRTNIEYNKLISFQMCAIALTQ